jgi:ABC-type transport system involved in multi-copper enzyme maturation permease subunit
VKIRLRRPFLEFPLLQRELIGLLRTRKAFWLLLSVVALSSLLPLLAWPKREASMFLGFQSLFVFQIFFPAQLTLALLVIPAFTAGAISGERERETYEVLYSTLISPFSIVVSKTLASTGYALLLIIAAAPSVCVLFLLGGMSFSTILRCYAMIFAAAVTAGLICMKESMRSRRTAHAAVRGVLWVAFWNGGLQVILSLAIAIAVELFRIPINPGNLWGGGLMLALSPFSGIACEIFGQVGPGPGGSLGEIWLMDVFYLAVVSACQLVYLLRKVRTPEPALSRRAERRLLHRLGRTRSAPRRALVAKALIGLGERGVAPLANPVFLKEVRSEFFSRPWYRRLMFFGALALFSGIAYLNRSSGEGCQAASTYSLVLILLVCPAIAAGAIPREIEQGNLDFLRGTLLSLGEILWGKFLASLYGSAGLMAATLWTFLIFTDGSRAWLSGSVVLVTMLFVNSLGSLASAISKRSLGALAISYLSVLAIFVLWPICLLILGQAEEQPLVLTCPFMALWNQRDGSSGGLGFCFLFGMASVILLVVSMAILENVRARDP